MSLETIDQQYLGLQPQDLLLDLGCGEGRHTISLGLGESITAVGLDLSARDLRTASLRLADFTFTDADDHLPVCFTQGTGDRLPFRDNAFSQVVCSEVLEHIPDYVAFLREIKRVIRPGGVLAVSVPAAFPEWVCWKLSDAYHEVEGGHVRIFSASELNQAIEGLNFKRYKTHRAHALHVPYWWLKCLLWRSDPQHPIVQLYHRFLVWDLMQKPWISRGLERLLNPILGKSIVMYYTVTDPDPKPTEPSQ